MKKYFILAAAALAMASCSNDESGNVANNETINLTTGLRGSTRALDQDIQATQIANGKSVWVEFTSSDTPTEALNTASPAGPWDASTKKATVAYTANGSGNLSTTTPVKWPVDNSVTSSTKVSIKAWAPFSAPPTTTFSVQADQSSDDNYIASDYLYGTAADFGHSAINNPVLVKFDHMLAKINVNLFTTDPAISLDNAKVEFLGSKIKGDISATDGTISNPSGPATAIMMTSSIVPTGTYYTCSAIIIPQTITNGTQIFKITLADATEKQYSLSVNKIYEAKKVYNYNITINASETIVLNEQINPWTTDASNNESIIATD